MTKLHKSDSVDELLTIHAEFSTDPSTDEVKSALTMPARNRTHAITFRLGNREYQELVKAVHANGSRSVSEFTRAAVLNRVVAANLEQFLENDLKTLVARLEAFDEKVRELRRQIRDLLSNSECVGA